ncbi:MAG: Fic family protein, partial [Planctomycetes bacterium]|nr:Fic family protein [Planctomycetota bacterium]
VGAVHAEIMARAAAFLLLKDSKASFAIEGEKPQMQRAERWSRAIAQAGHAPLDMSEFLRLQQIVIEDTRFTKMGWRREGGFVGSHERESGQPIPEHVSARHQDVKSLVAGLIETDNRLKASRFDPILTAALISFGFVFIHPFSDGNGRLHRYLIHHVLAAKEFTPPGLVFPVSAVILERIDRYRQVLESFSKPRLELIEWRPTEDGNVEVINDTADLYRFFDATEQAEFLYECVNTTVNEVLPQEVAYLGKYDRMKSFIDSKIDMPDRKADLLIRFLRQNDGKFSARAKSDEFKTLKAGEIKLLEKAFANIFSS